MFKEKDPITASFYGCRGRVSDVRLFDGHGQGRGLRLFLSPAPLPHSTVTATFVCAPFFAKT